MSRIRALLFDLDGTLLDSAPDLVAALNWVRRGENLPPLSLLHMKPFASRGAIGLLQAGMPEADAGTFEEWRQRFITFYADNSYCESSLFEGVRDMLDFLGDSHIPWGIVTNKTEALTLPILDAAGLTKSVACVVCGDTLNESKPHPAPVTLACGVVDVDPADVVMVGDDVRDIQAGRAAGTQTAAVFYGYGSGDLNGEVVEGSYPVHEPADLVSLIKRNNAQPSAKQ